MREAPLGPGTSPEDREKLFGFFGWYGSGGGEINLFGKADGRGGRRED